MIMKLYIIQMHIIAFDALMSKCMIITVWFNLLISFPLFIYSAIEEEIKRTWYLSVYDVQFLCPFYIPSSIWITDI